MLNVITTTSEPLPSIPNFSAYTVKQIKDWAIINDIKIPSAITKKDNIIQYLLGKLHERNTGLTTLCQNIVTQLDLLHPRIHDPNLDWLAHLHIHGWAVAPITGWDVAFTDIFLSWFESCSSNFNKHDHTTWEKSNMPTMLHGILKHYFGHTELQWRIRELCAPIFARIWGCQINDLLCSFDGGCFLPAIPKSILKNTSFKQWIHCDQPRTVMNFASVQGIVNFEENGPEDGGLVLVEGSHHVFSDYMKKHPSGGITWEPSDMNDPLLATLPLIKICAPPGHIILFDSRIFHCNVHPYGSIFRENGAPRFRMCTYVSMQPRIGANQKELAKRIKLYENGRMTGHWCYGPWFKETDEHPRFKGEDNKPPIIEIASPNQLRSQLIGY
jgi:hypothetical protein